MFKIYTSLKRMRKNFCKKGISLFTALIVLFSSMTSVFIGSVVAESEEFVQNFESYPYTLTGGTKGFEIYTANGTNDTNVYEGSHSLYRNGHNATCVVSLSDGNRSLTIGKTYKLTYKIKVTDLGTGGGLQFITLSQASNPWSYAKLQNLDYIGSGYTDLNKWVEKSYVFEADRAYFGFANWGSIKYYLDDVTITEVPFVTISFEMGEGEARESLTGAAGAALTLENPTPPEGKVFGGWFTDAAFSNYFLTTTYPDTDITLYAKWVEEGTFEQNFENYPYTLTGGDKGFEIYTATQTNDTNVYEGTHSLYRNGHNATCLVSLSDGIRSLTIGKTYKLTYKIKVTDLGTGGGLQFVTLSQASNPWSYAKIQSLDYIGTGYNKLNEWVEKSYVFEADRAYFGFGNWGSIKYYLDDVKITEVPFVTISFEMGEGEARESLTGAAGAALTLEIPTPPEGKVFGGWYLDATLKTPFQLDVYPNTDLTIYAKWIKEGTFEQNFENYPYTLTGGDKGFEIYTANGTNDTNVYEGSHSLYRNNHNATCVVSLTDKYSSLVVGKAYKLSYKIKVTSLGTGGGLQFMTLSVRDNPWSYAKLQNLSYIGSGYNSLNEWVDGSYVFVADNPYFGFANWGDITYYLDDVTVTEVPFVTISFEMGEGEAIEPLTGATGATLTLENPIPPEGMLFSGWYTDSALTEYFKETVYPDKDITLYPKWIKDGNFNQDFENYDLSLNNNLGFEIYTANADNDTNVYEGSHSLYRNNHNATCVASLADKYSVLSVGKAYKLSYKIKVTSLGTGGGLQFMTLSVRDNPWSYTKLQNLSYIGSGYKSLNEWVDGSYVFVADNPYFGFANWGDITYYLDYVTITEVPFVTISFEMGEGEAKEPITGAAGAVLTLENPVAPQGKAFAGWYSDAELITPCQIDAYPDKDITLYAKWIKEGTFEQDFEAWQPYNTSNVFSLYTAKDENDPNVYSGKHSVLYSNENANNTFALSFFDSTMGELKIGEKYKVSIRFKPQSTSLDEWSQEGTYHSIYYTTQLKNCWSWEQQGPQGRYNAIVFYRDEFGDNNWSGTSNAVTTTTKKDKNGWLTMDYEITAQTNYIALYMTGFYSMFIDYITISALPSGVISEDYAYPYTENFYNLLDDEIVNSPNKEEKNIYEIELDKRTDYVFTVSLKKGSNAIPKVYLAWDKEGENIIDGTVFKGITNTYKVYSSRILTDFSGKVYVVVEGGGAASSNYFALFPTKYGLAEEVRFEYNSKVDYSALPKKYAEEQIDGFQNDFDEDSFGESWPNTGSETPIIPIILLFVSLFITALTMLFKRGECNE